MSVKGTPYNHRAIEQKWQKIWDDEKAFAATDDYSKPKYYAHGKHHRFLAHLALLCCDERS